MSDRDDEKKSLRILIVTHAPLAREFGAGQVAINLADALREQGHNVTLWSPHPLPKLRRWMRFQNIPLMRNKLDEFIETKDPFDIIDCCSFLITQKVSKSTLVVSRSVQPDILYTLSNLLNPRNLKEKVLMPVSFFFGLVDISFVLRGWATAHYILCLGFSRIYYNPFTRDLGNTLISQSLQSGNQLYIRNLDTILQRISSSPTYFICNLNISI